MTVTNCNNQVYNNSHGRPAAKSKFEQMLTTDFADIFQADVLNSHGGIYHNTSWKKHQCNDKQITFWSDLPGCEWMDACIHTGFSVCVFVGALRKHGFVGYKINSKYTHVSPQSWNVTHLWTWNMIAWLWLNKKCKCRRKKYVPIDLLIDLLGGHQQPTTERKTERQFQDK